MDALYLIFLLGAKLFHGLDTDLDLELNGQLL